MIGHSFLACTPCWPVSTQSVLGICLVPHHCDSAWPWQTPGTYGGSHELHRLGQRSVNNMPAYDPLQSTGCTFPTTHACSHLPVSGFAMNPGGALFAHDSGVPPGFCAVQKVPIHVYAAPAFPARSYPEHVGNLRVSASQQSPRSLSLQTESSATLPLHSGVVVVVVDVVDAKHMPHVVGQSCKRAASSLHMAYTMPSHFPVESGIGCAPLHSSQSLPPQPPPKSGLLQTLHVAGHCS